MGELVRKSDGSAITAGDEVTVRGITATVVELEFPDPEFCGCVHLKGADGKEFSCSDDELEAQFVRNDGQPYTFGDFDDREEFDSGRWTAEDTASMERGRDLPFYNDAGEPCY